MPCLLGTDLCGGGARRRSREGGEGGARHGAVLPTRLQIRTGANPWDHHSCWSPEPRLGEKDDRSKSVCQLNNAKTDLRKIDAGEEWIETSPGENVETPGGRLRAPVRSEAELQLALEAVLSGCARLDGHEEVVFRIVAADFVLNEEQVLPDQISIQPDINTEFVGAHIHAGGGSHIVVGNFRDHRIGFLRSIPVKQSHVACLTGSAEARQTLPGVIQETGAHVARAVKLDVGGHLMIPHLPAVVAKAVLEMSDLEVGGGEHRPARRGGGGAAARDGKDAARAELRANHHWRSCGRCRQGDLVRIAVPLQISSELVMPARLEVRIDGETLMEEIGVFHPLARQITGAEVDTACRRSRGRTTFCRRQGRNVGVGQDILSAPEFDPRDTQGIGSGRDLEVFLESVETNIFFKQEARIIGEEFRHPATEEIDVRIGVITGPGLTYEDGTAGGKAAKVGVVSEGIVGGARCHLKVEIKLVVQDLVDIESHAVVAARVLLRCGKAVGGPVEAVKPHAEIAAKPESGQIGNGGVHRLAQLVHSLDVGPRRLLRSGIGHSRNWRAESPEPSLPQLAPGLRLESPEPDLPLGPNSASWALALLLLAPRAVRAVFDPR